MFTYVAAAAPRGNENIRRVCGYCLGAMFVRYGAQSYRCPHCDRRQ